MNKGKASITILCLAGALAATTVQAQQTQNEQGAAASRQGVAQTGQIGQETHEMLFSKMRGEQVKSATGKKVASLEDLVIDPNTGQIQFAVVGEGGFFGLGQRLVPVPWQKVKQASNRQIAVNVTQRKLNSAPKIAGNYSNLNKPGFISRIDQYYSVTPSEVGGAQAPSGMQQGSGSKNPGASNARQNSGINGQEGQQK